MKITVLAGGFSPERDVSLSSGARIANALMEKGHDVFLLDSYLGSETANVEYRNISAQKQYSYTVPEEAPDLKELIRSYGKNPIGRNVLKICSGADVVFIALHGGIGENGKLQAVFDVNGIRYTGTGYMGCLLAMDKDISKRLMVQAGIRTARWKLLESGSRSYHESDFGPYPCVVKPCSCGSSIGITMAENRQELDAALKEAEKYEEKILIEEKIVGTEFSCGILDGQALPVIEIVPKTGFYDYKNKYQADMTEEICPASIDGELARRIGETALSVHRLLQLGYYSRTDFIVTAAGDICCLETNTLPGMTPTSLLPQEAKAAGISYEELCDRIARAGV